MSSGHMASCDQEKISKMTPDDQPLNEEERVVQNNNGGLTINVTEYGAKTHRVEAGDIVHVQTHLNGIFIPFDDE